MLYLTNRFSKTDCYKYYHLLCNDITTFHCSYSYFLYYQINNKLISTTYKYIHLLYLYSFLSYFYINHVNTHVLFRSFYFFYNRHSPYPYTSTLCRLAFFNHQPSYYALLNQMVLIDRRNS